MRGAVSGWIGPSRDERGGVSGGLAGSSHRPCSGAEEPAGVAGSRVDGVHHAVTRSALDVVRRWAESEAEGRRREGDVIARLRVHPSALLDHPPCSRRCCEPAGRSGLQFRRPFGGAMSRTGPGLTGPLWENPARRLVSDTAGTRVPLARLVRRRGPDRRQGSTASRESSTRQFAPVWSPGSSLRRRGRPGLQAPHRGGRRPAPSAGSHRSRGVGRACRHFRCHATAVT